MWLIGLLPSESKEKNSSVASIQMDSEKSPFFEKDAGDGILQGTSSNQHCPPANPKGNCFSSWPTLCSVGTEGRSSECAHELFSKNNLASFISYLLKLLYYCSFWSSSPSEVIWIYLSPCKRKPLLAFPLLFLGGRFAWSFQWTHDV